MRSRTPYAASAVSLLTALFSVGCTRGGLDPNCTDERRPGIVLALEDATTGARQPFANVVAIAQDGSFGDTARIASMTTDPRTPPLIALAFERPGTYEVTVSATGYAASTVSDVRVQEDDACRHVITRALIVRLVPQAKP